MSVTYKLHLFLGATLLVSGMIGCSPPAVDAPDPHPDGSAVGTAASESPSAADAAGSLGVGDPAPPLALEHWVTGEPIEDFASGKVYVIEFWATWCGPCRVSMPHLSELQQQYADQVQIVGVTRETEDVVREFLDQEQSPGKTWAEAIAYRLATDDEDQTNNDYMRAAGQGGIPTAFIVGRSGLVEWIGHPLAMDEPLRQIVAGDGDRAAAAPQGVVTDGVATAVAGPRSAGVR